MKERPILFNGESVRAILAGRKTQTRRVIKPQPILGQPWKHGWIVDPEVIDIPIAYCPYGIEGDKLWVRETFQMWANEKGEVIPHYRADHPRGLPFEMTWKPSIFMPRWASRITLKVAGVRIERVQDISEEDALAEGVYDETGGFFTVPPHEGRLYTARDAFALRWDSINAKRGFDWDSNPWVWVIEFKLANS